MFGLRLQAAPLQRWCGPERRSVRLGIFTRGLLVLLFGGLGWRGLEWLRWDVPRR
jgi:hypothetical protein